MNSNFKIKKTKKKGNGVFTTRAFNKGDIVHLLSGDRVTSREMDRRIEVGLETCDDPFQISRTLYIDLSELSRSINHSCDPNCGIIHENKLIAIRNIRPGEEINYDYSTTVPQYKSWWKMKCHCKSQICRRVISSFNKIPKNRLDFYHKLRVLPLWVRKFKKYARYS